MFVKDLDIDLSFASRRRAITTSLDEEQRLCNFAERDLNAVIGQTPWRLPALLINAIGGLKVLAQHHVHQPPSALPRRRRGPSLAPAFVALTHVSQTFLKRPSVWLSCRLVGLELNAGASSISSIGNSAMLSERV